MDDLHPTIFTAFLGYRRLISGPLNNVALAAKGEIDQRRQRQEAAHNFMSAMAGKLANFGEAARALCANDRERFSGLVDRWPTDVRDHAFKIAFGWGS